MTKLYVQEFVALANTDEGDPALVLEPPLAAYVVDYTAGVTPGPKFNALTRFVEIVPDSICSIKFGTFGAVVAAVTDMRYAANERLLRGVSPPDFGATGMGLSAITNT